MPIANICLIYLIVWMSSGIAAILTVTRFDKTSKVLMAVFIGMGCLAIVTAIVLLCIFPINIVV